MLTALPTVQLTSEFLYDKKADVLNFITEEQKNDCNDCNINTIG